MAEDDAADRLPVTPLTLFVCTYVARLSGLNVGVAALTAAMCEAPRGPLLAMNSNYGHAAQAGSERYVKAPRPPRPRPAPAVGRARKVQGDGTCFNSAIEPVFRVAHPGLPTGKVYKVKCFPTTGETQVPGVVCPDLSDGHAVLTAFVGYLNGLAVCAAAGPVAIASEAPQMLNFKFRVAFPGPRVIVDMQRLAGYLRAVEAAGAGEGWRDAAAAGLAAAGWAGAPLPPYPVRETKPPTDDVKVTFRFRAEQRPPRVNVFQSGKINILGADSEASARAVHAFFAAFFVACWPRLTCVLPTSDRERAAQAAAQQAAAAQPADAQM
jgi:hypothetical protein